MKLENEMETKIIYWENERTPKYVIDELSAAIRAGKTMADKHERAAEVLRKYIPTLFHDDLYAIAKTILLTEQHKRRYT